MLYHLINFYQINILHFLLNMHTKLCVNKILLTIQFINSYFMYNFKGKLQIIPLKYGVDWILHSKTSKT